MEKAIRTFIALPIGRQAHDQLRALQAAWRPSLSQSGIRWVDPNLWHLTLVFLGEVLPSRLTALHARLHDVAHKTASFQITPTQHGVFPTAHRPKVIWLGMADPMDALPMLQARIQTEVQAWGGPSEDRPYHPHLTLARITTTSGSMAGMIAEAMSRWKVPPLEGWRCDQVDLMESQLSPQGPTYQVRASFRFGA